MAEKGRSIDNIGIERLFMPLKYDEVFINDCRSVAELRAGVQTVSELLPLQPVSFGAGLQYADGSLSNSYGESNLKKRTETVAQVRFQISCSRTDGFSRVNRSCSALRSPIFPVWGGFAQFLGGLLPMKPIQLPV